MLKYSWRKYEVITFLLLSRSCLFYFLPFFKFWYQQSNPGFLCQANQHCWAKSSAALSSPPLSLKMGSSLIYPDYRFPLSTPSAFPSLLPSGSTPFLSLIKKEQDEVIIFIISTFLHMELLSWRECQDSYQSMSGVI